MRVTRWDIAEVSDDAIDVVRQIVLNDKSTDLISVQRNEIVLLADRLGMLKGIPPQSRESVNQVCQRFNSYCHTIKYLARLLDRCGIEYAFIKTFRAYPRENTDVNVLIAKADQEAAIAALIGKGWSRPPTLSRAKAWLGERGKPKVDPPGGGLLEAHFYPDATWHGLTYVPGNQILSLATRHVFEDVSVNDTSDVADLLMHYGHCVFERYQLTLGELIHLGIVRSELGDDGIASARLIATEWGWEEAFDVVESSVVHWWSDMHAQLPLSLPLSELRFAWRKRAGFHLRRRQMWLAVEEIIQHYSWSGFPYALYRKAKGAARGGYSNPKLIQSD